MSDDLVKQALEELQEIIGGCHDGHCVVRKPKGMHTNGGCTCLEDLRLHERSRIGHLLRCAQGMADRIEELETQVKAVDALVEAGNIMARGLEGDYIVPGSANKWNAALATYRATKEGGA